MDKKELYVEGSLCRVLKETDENGKSRYEYKVLEPKTLKSKRTVPLLPIAIEALEMQKKRQEENKLVLPENVCKYCGATLIHTEGHRKKQFCGKKCSNAWWNAQTAKNAARDKVHTCPGCGKEFYSSGKKTRKYCTFDCYINDRFHKGGAAI